MPKIISTEEAERPYRKRSVRNVRLFIGESVISKMALHGDLGFADSKEVMGFIMGTVYSDEEGDYAIAEGIATTRLLSTDISVRFDPESFEDLFLSMDESKGDKIVGWYHTHPGFSCYLSETDLKTHVGMFGEGLGFSIVLDPSDETLMVFTVKDGKPEKEQMIIFEEG
ncbi:MAG TPA: Mov34/MPN/PAD-1 family protein [Candidatus Methanomethylophilaceae archaeon]|nr:Mov34/MPN/PAD-1 family protein [Candidatus Methanomethylophilaceae archaeon]